MKIFSKNQNLANTLSTFHLVLHKSDHIPLKNFQGEENFLPSGEKSRRFNYYPLPPLENIINRPWGEGDSTLEGVAAWESWLHSPKINEVNLEIIH